jgi:hypothetical protein
MPNYIKVLPNVEVGSLQIHQGISQGLYSDQSSAEGYLVSAIDKPCSKVYLDVANDVLFFDVPQGTFSNPSFLSTTSAFIIDFNNLLQYADNCFNQNSGNNIIGQDASDTQFGYGCFAESSGNNTFLGGCLAGKDFFTNSTGNNTIGYCEAGDNAFAASSGNNKIGEFIGGDGCFSFCFGNNTIGDGTFGKSAFAEAQSELNTITNIIDAGGGFGKNYQGNFMIRGNIGASNLADLTGTNTFFERKSESGANLIVQLAKLTSNEGEQEGDLTNAGNNGATVNCVLI